MRLKDKVTIVTGSACGIGKAIAMRFAREGSAVVINYTKSQIEADETMRELSQIGSDALLVQADISRETEAQSLIDQTVKRYGGVDILINNAGITQAVKLTDLDGLTEAMWDNLFAVNVKGAFFCARAAAQHIKHRGGGAIINITSAAAFTGRGSSIAYVTCKAALVSLTRSLSIALAPDIRVNAIAPGFVPTRWHAEHESWHSGIIRETPLGRLGHPEDIASLALALVTDASFVTGQTIICDGGITYR